MKAPLAAVYDWTGFYFGVNAGVGLGRDLTHYTIAISSPISYVNPFGAIGGAQIGYNWQAGNWVFGLNLIFKARVCATTKPASLIASSTMLFVLTKSWTGLAPHAAALASPVVRC